MSESVKRTGRVAFCTLVLLLLGAVLFVQLQILRRMPGPFPTIGTMSDPKQAPGQRNSIPVVHIEGRVPVDVLTSVDVTVLNEPLQVEVSNEPLQVSHY